MALVHRPARAADAGAIAAFQLAMALETEGLALDAETCARGVAAVFADPAKGRYFVSEADGRVEACLLLTREWSDWRDGEVWWIQSVYVAPALRRTGAFRGLYAHVKALAEADGGVRGLRLYVDKRNAAAQRTYAALGMTDGHYALFEWMKGA